MLAKQTKVLAVLSLILTAGCSTPTNQIHQQAENVHVRMDSQFDAANCEWLGEVTGNEGHWYSYLFFANDVLVQGAINDVKNRAKQLGANTVYMVTPQDFATSFTVLGNAYLCPVVK